MCECKLSPILHHSFNCRTLLQEEPKWKVLWDFFGKTGHCPSFLRFFFLFFTCLFFLLVELTKKPLTKILYYLLLHRMLSGTLSPWPLQASLCHSGSGFWAHHRQMEHKGCHSPGFQWWAPENEQRAVKPLLHPSTHSIHSQHPTQVTQGLQQMAAIALMAHKFWQPPGDPWAAQVCPVTWQHTELCQDWGWPVHPRVLQNSGLALPVTCIF